MSDQFWLEVRAWKARRGLPFFVRLGEEARCSGFRSVYAYSQDLKDEILARGTTAEMGLVPVYSDVLLLDFDSGDTGDFGEWLIDEGVAFESYISGGRSIHLHVHIVPMFGERVPYSQKGWVIAHAPLADVSFYHAAGQYRLPGTVHEKTGKRKQLTLTHPGRRLEIPTLELPRLMASGVGGQRETSGAFLPGLMRRKGPGERTVYTWHLAKVARREGVEFDVACTQILWWNRTYSSPPQPEDHVLAKIKEVYAR